MNDRHADTDLHSNDLTQLSSREQLSALMDGALPADQTRFLLRRLQHDASLAGSWERWRIAGEAMRGLAPSQRLPADFASRVSAALHGENAPQPPVVPRQPRAIWLRWGGGAAMAASLAVVALLAVRPADAPVEGGPGPLVAAAPAPANTPAPSQMEPSVSRPVATADSPAALVAAAAAVAARPARERAVAARAVARQQGPASATKLEMPAVAGVLPPPAIVTRPWPRAVLPQYANGGLAVGFGGNAEARVADNPFGPPPLALVPAYEPAAVETDASPDAAAEAPAAAKPAPATDQP